jgi:hypothetical protein
VEIEVVIVEESAQMVVESVPVTVRAGPGVPAPAAGRVQVHPAAVNLILRGTRRAIDKVDRGTVAAVVALHAEDLQAGRARPAQVLADGLPPGVAVEPQPREVTLTAGRK